MAPFSTVQDGRMISVKYRGICIRVEESATANNIVDSLALSVCHVDDIEMVQPMPGSGNCCLQEGRTG